MRAPPKPRLTLIDGRWFCQCDWFRGIGPTRLEAYRNWLRDIKGLS